MLEILAFLLPLVQAPQIAFPTFAILAGTSVFHPAERAVGNWRMQAALDLDLGVDTALRWVTGTVPANLPRCIRLNNYWCMKKAGWSGEIGADPEGHAAFASAEQGAVAAIVLLRRYYVDYGRKSARAIVTHWAPAQCELSMVPTGAQSPSAATSLGPLAKFGLGKTLRARWLAAHGRGGTAITRRGSRKSLVKRSVVPDRLASPRRPQAIARGTEAREPALVLEPPIKSETLRLASVSPPTLSRDTPLAPAPQSAPVASCAADTQRLANYAAHAIEGIARSPEEDLKLFGADGGPLPALSRLLANMAAVEIGPYRADGNLIDAAIESVRNAPWRTAGAGQ
jgi:hypothetical protein